MRRAKYLTDSKAIVKGSTDSEENGVEIPYEEPKRGGEQGKRSSNMADKMDSNGAGWF
jgi:hypothetical protein